ncbi:MAG: hypothetical protein U0694_16650 [Anaerolineae bacterium]
MADTPTLNYPDILGEITNGARFNTGVVQVALALRPRVVRAGRPFEVILLVQNASDADIDVAATLSLPDTDAAKKKGRFVTKAGRLVVGLKPAEVGYVVQPVSTMPDTAVSADYKIGVDIKAQPAAKGGKPQRVRLPEGGGPVEQKHLHAETKQHIEELKNLHYITHAKSKLTGGNVLEAPLSIMTGKLGEIAELKPGWVSLWTLSDHQDDRLLLFRYKDDLLNGVLPKLKRARLYGPLLEVTQAHFEKGGYPLHQVEAQFVAKLLTLILEYASPSELSAGGHGELAAGDFNLQPLLDPERLADPRPIVLPHWCSGFMRLLPHEPRAAAYPVETITRMLYNELLQDAMTHAFKIIEQSTGEELGDENEMQEYIGNTIERLNGKGQLDFTHAYMPLVLGGLVMFDSVIMPGEKLEELVNETNHMLEVREEEKDDDNELVFTLTQRLVERAVMKYGYRDID